MNTSVMVTAIVRDWLPRIGAEGRDPEMIAIEVSAQIDALPSPLRLGVRGLERALSVLPGTTGSRLASLPVSGEYFRLVRTLTTVVCLADEGAEQ